MKNPSEIQLVSCKDIIQLSDLLPESRFLILPVEIQYLMNKLRCFPRTEWGRKSVPFSYQNIWWYAVLSASVLAIHAIHNSSDKMIRL